MSDLREYIENRMVKDAEFAAGYEEGYANFKLGSFSVKLAKRQV